MEWKNGVPAEKLQLMRQKYGLLFNVSSLESQLKFVYKDKDFLKDNWKIKRGLPVSRCLIAILSCHQSGTKESHEMRMHIADQSST